MSKEQSIKPKKSLGQNFLHDPLIVEGILAAADITEGDRVLEIGPGTGALTGPLLARGADVTAVELDHDLVVRLADIFKDSEGLSLLENNILDMDMGEYLKASRFEDGKYKVVANIPYYITAPILRMLLALPIHPERIILMVQKEVAERISALPGSMSILAVAVQYYADARILFEVPKSAFDPVPKVDSAIVEIVPKRSFDPDMDRQVFRVVRAGFAARRKTLSNNLAASFRIPRKDVDRLLETMNLDKRVRAQELSIGEWEILAEKCDAYSLA